MKVTVDRRPMLEALRVLGKVVAGPGVGRPMLANVLLRAGTPAEGVLHLAATDLEVYVQVHVPAEVVLRRGSGQTGKAGACCARADVMGEALAASGSETATMSWEDGAEELRLEADGAEWVLVCEDGADFPEAPPAPSPLPWSLPAPTLERLVRQSAYAVAGEKGRYALNGIFLHARVEELRAAGANGAVLALAWGEVQEPWTVPNEEGTACPLAILVPPRVFDLALAAVVPDPEDEDDEAPPAMLGLGLVENTLFLRGECGSVAAQLIEGEFPNYEEVLPHPPFKAELRIGRLALRRAMRQAQVTTNEMSVAVDVGIGATPAHVLLGSEAADVGASSVDLAGGCICELTGEPCTMALNPANVLDALRAMGGDEVTVKVKDARSPLVIECEGPSATLRTGALAVISPVIRPEDGA